MELENSASIDCVLKNTFFHWSSIFKSLQNGIELVTRHDTPAYMKDITEVSKDNWRAFFNENSTTIECVQGKNHIFMVRQYSMFFYLSAIIIHVSKQLVIKWYLTKFFEIFGTDVGSSSYPCSFALWYSGSKSEISASVPLIAFARPVLTCAIIKV